MWMIVTFIFGGALGFLVSRVLSKEEPVGTLRVDTSDPDGPYLFLESIADPRVFSQRKHVVLNVETKNYISQE